MCVCVCAYMSTYTYKVTVYIEESKYSLFSARLEHIWFGAYVARKRKNYLGKAKWPATQCIIEKGAQLNQAKLGPYISFRHKTWCVSAYTLFDLKVYFKEQYCAAIRHYFVDSSLLHRSEPSCSVRDNASYVLTYCPGATC